MPDKTVHFGHWVRVQAMQRYQTLKAFAKAAGYDPVSMAGLWHMASAEQCTDKMVARVGVALGMTADDVMSRYKSEPATRPKFKQTASRKASLSGDEISEIRAILPILRQPGVLDALRRLANSTGAPAHRPLEDPLQGELIGDELVPKSRDAAPVSGRTRTKIPHPPGQS
jgi:hypothetical protein